jgi:serine/threonine protein kinase
MGVVYRARQPGLRRTVAVKTLRTPAADTRDRFRREAEAMARLDHPHIAPVYEVGEWRTPGGRAVPYFAMKWYPGGGLDARPCGPGSDPVAHARVVETVARALHHAHQRGVLHRDLKPSNVLLNDRGEPAVADFGLAGLFDPDEQPHGGSTGTARPGGTGAGPAVVLGTPGYMAPEQARNPSRVTTAADVYGLGAVLYHLLTGRPPFQSENPYLTLELVTTSAPPPPTALNPAVPLDLEAICLKCLEKHPAARYSSAEAAADDLARFAAGRPVAARPRPVWVHAWRWVRRHPATTAMAVLALAALVVLAAVLAAALPRGRDREAANGRVFVPRPAATIPACSSPGSAPAAAAGSSRTRSPSGGRCTSTGTSATTRS